jgi:hypothetical protein
VTLKKVELFLQYEETKYFTDIFVLLNEVYYKAVFSFKELIYLTSNMNLIFMMEVFRHG